MNFLSRKTPIGGFELIWLQSLPDSVYLRRRKRDLIRVRPHERERNRIGRPVYVVYPRLQQQSKHVSHFVSTSRHKFRGVLTGTIITESATNSFLSQCNTMLPSKWPPVLIAVTPGMMVSEGPEIRRRRPSGSSRLSHSLSLPWT